MLVKQAGNFIKDGVSETEEEKWFGNGSLYKYKKVKGGERTVGRCVPRSSQSSIRPRL